MLEMDCIMFKKKIMGTGLKTEQESHMKMLTIMHHRTSSLRERRILTQLKARGLSLFCCLACAKETHSLIKPNPQLTTAYREHVGTTVIANREKNGRAFLSVRKVSVFKNAHQNSSWASYAAHRNRKAFL